MTCLYCKKGKLEVEAERDCDIAFKFGPDAIICCTPDSECRCPMCNSMSVRFFEFDHGTDRDTGYRDAGEAFACGACGASGEASDCEPPVRPWQELAAVAETVVILRRSPAQQVYFAEVA